MSTNSRLLGAKLRKPKARTLRDSDWDPYKDRISQLYSLHPLKDVIGIIEAETEFRASERQYKSRINKWRLDKKIKPNEMIAIVRKRQRRKLEEGDKTEYRFCVNNIEVPSSKIDRWMQMHDVPEGVLFVPSPAASTPSVVDCRTVSEPGTPGTRSLGLIAVFNDLRDIPYDKATAATFDNTSIFDRKSPSRHSPTPIRSLHGKPTSPPVRDAPYSMGSHRDDGPATEATIGHTPTPGLTISPESRSSCASDNIFFSDVRACWRRFQQVSHGTENLQAQLSRCKDFTERYIQDGSSSFDSARHALLDLADHNNLFVPTVTIDPTVVRTLLQYWLSIGYDINQRDRYGNTILLRECSVSYSNWTLGQAWITYLSILVEHGADLHATNICIGCGALHVLMRSIAARNFDPFTKEKLEAVSDALVLFLSAGCDPNARDFWGKMPLDHSKSWRGILTFSDLERSRVLEAVWRGALMRTSRARKRLAEQRASAS